MARYHLPARIPPRMKPTASTRRNIAAVLVAIESPATTSMSTEDMLAERERFRVEAEARRSRQGELVLRGKA